MKINRRRAVGQLLLGGVVVAGVIGCTTDKEDTLTGDTDFNIVADSGPSQAHITGNPQVAVMCWVSVILR